MKKDPLVFVKHILDSIKDIEDFSGGLSKNDFLKDNLRQSAILRKIEVMGEAVKNLPRDFTKKHSSIPWEDIAGMRDKVIHHYFGVDLNKVWNVVEYELPKLKKEIQTILEL